MNKKKFRMPKNKEEFYYYLKYAFKQGCNHGYGVQLDKDVDKQEDLGFQLFIDEISYDEYKIKMSEVE